MVEEKLMCNESEVVKIVNNTMTPQMLQIQHSIDSLATKVDYVINDSTKERKKLEKDLVEAQSEIKSLRKLLYGNGDDTPGLVEKINSNSKWIQDMKKFINVIIGALVVQIIGFLIVIGQHVLASQ